MKIIVLFKTHLDIGFTDFSENVLKKYEEKYIPDAIRVAREVAETGRPEGFVWTTGSYLISRYLKTVSEEKREQAENAIKNGWLSWHGLPFTFHSEVADAALLDYGLSLSEELDQRFGKKTIGAKMTDVPGHTAAIVPHLWDHGINFLHIGINPASHPVDLPPFFRWSFAGREIVCMYNNGDYGEFTRIPGSDSAICFAHTGDNMGPQSAEEILAVYNQLYKEYPEAEIVAGDLNAAAEEVLKIKESLPVITSEVGDTWIHGSATDPQKISQYKALLRLAGELSEEERKSVYEKLLPVPEHTWGLDEKTHLRDNAHYIRKKFDQVRNDYSYKKMELSWAEQRRYVLDAAACVKDENKRAAAMEGFSGERPDYKKLVQLQNRQTELNGMIIAFSADGSVENLVYREKRYADPEHRLFAFSYDVYSADEVWAFQKRYLKKQFLDDYYSTGRLNWAIEDFGKPGLEREYNRHTAYTPCEVALYRGERSLYVRYFLDQTIFVEQGLPEEACMVITPGEEEILFDFRWFTKPANRVPEALWLSFCPVKPLTSISKLGYPIDPGRVLSGGGRELHATDGEICFEDISLNLVDSILVSVGQKNIYRYENKQPSLEKGIYLNLFNNQWGTNFPMWNEGNARFRFVLR